MARRVSIEKLLSCTGSPYDIPLWRGLRDPIDFDEVRQAIEDNQLNSPVDNGASGSGTLPRMWHIGRIAWFVVNGWEEPIELDPLALWPVMDGNHRFAAAIFREDEDIEVEGIEEAD